MKIVSWNVNGVRAAAEKGFFEFLKSESPDIICLQETKISEHQIPEELAYPEGYKTIWSTAKRRGYSGTCTMFKKDPLSFKTGFGIQAYDDEGRVVETEHENFYIFNVYFPNGQKDEERLKYKLDFYKDFLEYTLDIHKKTGKEIIILGDFNTAHREIDLKNPRENENYSGFLKIEREWIDRYLEAGYVDVFRHFYPDLADAYTWWTYRFNARSRNVGWRIDYFMCTEKLIGKIRETKILKDVMGSDHCPISMIVDW